MNRWIVGITGGTGYIGSSLAKHLADSFEVKLLDITPPKYKLNGNVSYQFCDLRHFEEVEQAVENVDLVIHTAIVQIPAINEQKRLGYEVNFVGTQNVCKAVDESRRAKGLILSGSWHTIGERELKGVINEEFGFRPDKVESRAKLYVLAKIAQETIVRFYDEISTKIFGIIRMGTALGEGMPEKTAANIFIENGLNGKPLTPFKHSMFRPMLYVDTNDLCQAYENFAVRILKGKMNGTNSIDHIFNVFWPKPITVYDMAKMVKNAFLRVTLGQITPEIVVTKTDQPVAFNENDKNQIKIDVTKALKNLDLKKLRNPEKSIETLVKSRINRLYAMPSRNPTMILLPKAPAILTLHNS